MKYYVYKVKRVNSYDKSFGTFDYDYVNLSSVPFYYTNDYYISDIILDINKLYFNGDLIKIVDCVSEFEAENIFVKKASKVLLVNE